MSMNGLRTREVDDQEQGDRDGGQDRVDVQHLTPAVLPKGLKVEPPRPGLDQDVFVHGGHPLAAHAWRQLTQEEQADSEHDDRGIPVSP
jgi:hypothetical protein